MKKQQIQFFLLVLVLVLCIGGYYLAKQLPEEEEELITESYTVSDVVKEDVVGLSYFFEGEIIDLEKEDDVWYVKEDHSIALKQSDVDTMLGYVYNITTDTKVEEPQSLATYGLANPTNTICMTLNDGSVVQLLIGDCMDITGEYYALLAGDSNVYTISSYIVTAFEKTLDDLIESE